MTSLLLALSLLLIVAYGAFSWHFFSHWRGAPSWPRDPRMEHSLLGILLTVQAFCVLVPLVHGQLVALGVGHAVALVAWLMLVIYWTGSFFYRLEGLQLFLMPLALVTLALALLLPGSHPGYALTNPAFMLHLFVSMLAYSLFAISALLAVLMLALERALHRKRWTPLVKTLPPLLTLEKLMFRVIGWGFVLLSLTLVSGVLFSEQLFGKPATFTHKTLFGLISWLLFGTLLYGRSRHGWRGKLAIRWTLTGFVALMLAYVGSKVVLELILQRA
ncbi:cytochrome c biogenesis protein CcsA [Crenobacter sp. SG2303]|uniref:Cytochrome c biogenesis protein CcsA n=1 Tax=Crenobacter oryzisoli TaxID=3056844 RepID=A0ABT7XU01_9NEIS|nr:cytochrome c biogenesis protein CcsA [Crenobacter sp. SG2303]MDN0077284.1 cytochrome c biogenesis protein CcsA [Crenobacter sp. SG2303]